MEHEATEVRTLRDAFENAVLAKIPDTKVNGDRVNRLPNTSNIAFDGIEAEAVLVLLDQEGICCSSGSACTTGSVHASHVLKAMGFDNARARSSLRFSFSRILEAQCRKGAGRSAKSDCEVAPDGDCGLR